MYWIRLMIDYMFCIIYFITDEFGFCQIMLARYREKSVHETMQPELQERKRENPTRPQKNVPLLQNLRQAEKEKYSNE